MKLTQDPKLKREWLIKMESIALRSRMKHSFAQSTLSKRASNKLLRQSFVETLLQALSTSTQERRGTLQAGNLTKKNNEKQANNFRGAAGELLSHFPTVRFVFRSKTFPKNDALTQKHGNV